MQATAWHEPPTHRRSTAATFWPARARVHASSLPPRPLPRMTVLYCSGLGICILLASIGSLSWDGRRAFISGSVPGHAAVPSLRLFDLMDTVDVGSPRLRLPERRS